MPELPEVEVVRRGLDRWVIGRTIAEVEVYNPRSIRRHVAGAAHFAEVLTDRKLTAAHRRGKYLWLPTDGGDALIAHLGMSGQLLVQPVDAPDEVHLRARIRFDDGGRDLRFVDQRTFGGLSVDPLTAPVDVGSVVVGPVDVERADVEPVGAAPDAAPDGGPDVGRELVPASIAHIARDPLDPRFDLPSFTAAVRRRRTGVKRALLDQTLISGVGNIYADEALWRARLHYARPTETLTRVEVGRLVAGAREVMIEALEQGGTSFDALYVNVNGESGYFERELAVYGREDQACRRCGAPIRRDPFMNRSSYSCPRCQPRPRRARW